MIGQGHALLRVHIKDDIRTQYRGLPGEDLEVYARPFKDLSFGYKLFYLLGENTDFWIKRRAAQYELHRRELSDEVSVGYDLA